MKETYKIREKANEVENTTISTEINPMSEDPFLIILKLIFKGDENLTIYYLIITQVTELL